METLLLDVCFGLGSLLGAGLVLYGAWLCLHEMHATKGSRDEHESEAVLRQPRPHIRAGTGERELRSSQSGV